MNKLIVAAILSIGILALGAIWFYTRPKDKNTAFFNKKTYQRISFHIFAVMSTILSGIFFPIPPAFGDELLVTTGLLTYSMGFALAVSAKMEMNTVWGVPGQHDRQRQNKLIKTGPFSVTRNPIYVGALLVFFGLAVALKSYGVLLGFYYLYYVIKAVVKEEALLEEYFGMEYIAYKSRVPRFIPFFWK